LALLAPSPSEKLLDPPAAAGSVRRGDTVMVGGFGLVGNPLALVSGLIDNPDATALTVVSGNLGDRWVSRHTGALHAVHWELRR
jgi:acyl CoA:acetate/3-ketoacid CoA transferase alpha subunit